MKKLIFIASVALLQFGCATVPQSNAIQSAVEWGSYDGINKDSEFYVTVPASHSGPYSSVSSFNFQMRDGKFKEKDVSAILGKSRKTGEWEVLMLLTKKDGHWAVLPKKK